MSEHDLRLICLKVAAEDKVCAASKYAEDPELCAKEIVNDAKIFFDWVAEGEVPVKQDRR